VIDQPNTSPPILNKEVYLERMKLAEEKTYIDYGLNLGLTEENIGELSEILEEIKKYFVPAIGEVFLSHPTMQVSYETLKKAKEIVKEVKICVHAEDPELLKIEPLKAEVEAVRKCLEIDRFHFCHLSIAQALNMVSKSSSTAEVTPHHLLLSEESKLEFKKVNPPLRKKDIASSLLENLYLADVIASDHAPHSIEDKKLGSPGFPGVETMYPLMFSLVRRGLVGIGEVVEKIAINPA
jgi:dihydroorotase